MDTQVVKCMLVRQKKPNLDFNVLKNFKPVSNLPFLSKNLEKVVLKRLSAHLFINDLNEIHQSAYKKYHSTETALLKVFNDLSCDLDNRNVTLQALLDLSAAFDTLDHGILLKRLELSFGIKGKALAWFSSYLATRKQPSSSSRWRMLVGTLRQRQLLDRQTGPAPAVRPR